MGVLSGGERGTRTLDLRLMSLKPLVFHRNNYTLIALLLGLVSFVKLSLSYPIKNKAVPQPVPQGEKQMAINPKDFPNKIKPNLWANKEFNIFFYRFEFEGKGTKGLIDLSDKPWSKKDRISVAEAELIKIKNNKKEDINDSVTVDAMVQKVYALVKPSRSKQDMLSYYVRYIKPSIGNKTVGSVRQLHIQKIMNTLEENGLAPRTVKRTLDVLQPVFKASIANRIITFNPCDGIKIKLPKTKKIVVDATTKLTQIYTAIMEEFEDNPFYKALYLFALQGRRKSEILTLKWEDVNLKQGYYILRNTKNNEEQKIFLPEPIKEIISEFDKFDEYVFTSGRTGTRMININKVTARLKRRLNDDKFCLHYLRNVIVSAMAEQGLESIYLSGALGHNNPNTINKYLTLNYLRSSEIASGIIDEIVKK